MLASTSRLICAQAMSSRMSLALLVTLFMAGRLRCSGLEVHHRGIGTQLLEDPVAAQPGMRSVDVLELPVLVELDAMQAPLLRHLRIAVGQACAQAVVTSPSRMARPSPPARSLASARRWMQNVHFSITPLVRTVRSG